MFRSTPAYDLIRAHARVAFSAPLNIFNIVEPYRPMLDQIEFFEQPLDFFRSDKWQTNKEVIIGVTSEEVAQINILFADFTLRRTLFEVGFMVCMIGDVARK